LTGCFADVTSGIFTCEKEKVVYTSESEKGINSLHTNDEIYAVCTNKDVTPMFEIRVGSFDRLCSETLRKKPWKIRNTEVQY
jgi:hypothetical protein